MNMLAGTSNKAAATAGWIA